MPTSPRKGPDGGIGGRNRGTKTRKDDHAFLSSLGLASLTSAADTAMMAASLPYSA